MATPDAQRQHHEPHDSWTKWLASAIGLPTLFIALGYVIEQSRQWLLGVPINSFDPTTYTQVASEFLLRLAESVFDAGILAALIAAGLIVVGIPFLHIRHYARRSPRQEARLAASLLLAVVLLSGIKIAWYDLPVSRTQDLLLSKIQLDKPSAGFLSGLGLSERTKRVKRYIVCSHDDHGLLCEGPEYQTSQDAVRRLFLTDLGLTMLLCAVGVVALGSMGRLDVEAGASRYREGRRWLLHMMVIALLLADVYGALSVYGRTLEPINFDRGEVNLDPVVSTDSSDPNAIPAHVLVLSRDADEYTFLDLGRGDLWRVPRRLVRSFGLQCRQDAVEFHLGAANCPN